MGIGVSYASNGFNSNCQIANKVPFTNLIPFASLDKKSHAQWNVGWNYLTIPKLQWFHG